MLRKSFSPALLALVLALTVCNGFAADAPKPAGDTIIFVNGEQLSGSLVKVADGKVFFHSDMAGDITVEWAKVKELKTAKPYAVIAKKEKLTRKDNKGVPEGTLDVTNNSVAVANTTVPIAQTAYVVDQAAFDKAMNHHPGLTEGWVGSVTAGVSLVEATQDAETFTSGITLIRQSPAVDWMRTNSRTVIDFSNSYGKVSQTGTPTVNRMNISPTVFMRSDMRRSITTFRRASTCRNSTVAAWASRRSKTSCRNSTSRAICTTRSKRSMFPPATRIYSVRNLRRPTRASCRATWC